MNKFGKGLAIIIAIVVFLFIFQNAQRPPMVDTQGAYLSLDLLVWGVHLKKPLGVSILMTISFVFGVLTHIIFSAFMRGK